MNVWQCPKCGWHTHQPDHVTAVMHRCRPTIPRAVRLQPIPQPQQPVKEENPHAH